MAKGDLKKQLQKELQRVQQRLTDLQRALALMEGNEDAVEELIDLVTNRGKA